MERQLRINALAENNVRQQNVLIVISNVVDIDGIYENIILTQDYVVVYPINSSAAKTIMQNPREDLYINLKDYVLKRIDFDEVPNKFGYFHRDLNENLLEEMSDSQRNLYNETTSYTDCIVNCHADMFLYFFYKIVLLREFENELKSVSPKTLFDRFQNVISVMLMDAFKIKTEYYDDLSEEIISEIRLIYNDEINYADGFSLPVALYTTNNSEAKRISCEVLGDLFRLPYNYTQKVFIKALEIVDRRIKLNFFSKTYFAHEIMIGSNSIQLIVFPTFYAYTRLEEITDKWNNGGLLVEYLVENGFDYLPDLELDLKHKSKYIFRHPQLLTPFYNDLTNSLSLSSFGRQKRNKMSECIFNQGQINLLLK
jgi:hypothetical protein